MKILKITAVILIFSFVLISCSESSVVSINPPDWIIGTWQDDPFFNSVIFTQDNMILSIALISGDINLLEDNISVEESIGVDTYTLVLSDGDGGNSTLIFTKTSDTTMSLDVDGETIEELILQ